MERSISMVFRRLALGCFALALSACATPPPIAAPEAPVVYVIERGWHTDIGLPVEQITGPLTRLETDFPGVRFLTFGFGERQFLVHRRKTLGLMLSALLPSQSALLMTALRATPEAAFGQANVVPLHVSQAGLEQIEASIWREIEVSAGGEPTRLEQGPYPGSVFYAARDTYDAAFTCNTWSAETLRSGGLPMPTFGVVFAGQVMGTARRIGARRAELPRD